MATFKLTRIGELDLDHLNEHYDGMVKLGGATIALDFNIEGTTLPLASAKAAETFVSSLAKYAAAAKAFIDKELGNRKDTTVKDFLDFTFEGNHYVKGRRPITDQIIAVYLDAKGKVGHLSHES